MYIDGREDVGMMPKKLSRLVVCVLLLVGLSSAQTTSDARARLYAYVDSLANQQLAERAQTIAKVKTQGDAEKRKAAVRERHPSPDWRAAGAEGVRRRKGIRCGLVESFRVEKIAYESLPGFWVTADLYVPATGSGPYPAIVLAPGHGAGGKKRENWSWGANFARNGIVALAYDPIGQGERLQYYDTEKKASFIGNPTGEHGEANIGPMLIGDTIAPTW